MSHVADSPINRHFEPISGRFTPIRPTNQREERKGPATFGVREAWLARNVPLATDLPRLATTSSDQSSLTPPHAFGRESGSFFRSIPPSFVLSSNVQTTNIRAIWLRFGVFYLHQFAPFRFAGHYAVAHAHASRHAPPAGSGRRRPSPAGYCLTPTTDLSKTERDPIATSGPTIPVWHQTGRSLRKKQSVCPGSPPLDRSLTAGGAQRQSLQACLPMAISRNSCSLLDFPEFAQAVSYGVPELT